MTDALPPLSAESGTIVIVGAGLAGLRAAEGARGAGFQGRLVLIGDEPHTPYDRPPLSKAVLLTDDYEQLLPLLPPEQLSELHIELRLGQAATTIDRLGRVVVLANGERIAFDRLILATGSTARTIAGLEPRPGIHYLRTLDEALALRKALEDAQHVLIVGAGVIGMEVAAAAAQGGGRAVTVVEVGDRVMGRAAAPAIADFVSEQHRQRGVDVRLGATVDKVDETAEGFAVRLSSGSVVHCDLIVVGVGVAPNDELARGCGLETTHGGIVVDGYGMTSDPAIYAAGEVAVHFNALHARHDRQETWAHASAHGEHVGKSVVAPGAPYNEMGSYWSDQYDFTLNAVGAPVGEVDVVRGDPASGQFVVLHMTKGRVVGASAVNAVRELRAAKTLVGSDRELDPVALADPRTELRALAKADR